MLLNNHINMSSATTTSNKNGSNNALLLGVTVAASIASVVATYTAMKFVRDKETKAKEAEEERKQRLGRPDRSALIYDDPTYESGPILYSHNHEEKMKRRIAARVAVEEDNKTPRNSVTVRVPATSANVGPGCEYLLKKLFQWLTRHISIILLEAIFLCTFRAIPLLLFTFESIYCLTF